MRVASDADSGGRMRNRHDPLFVTSAQISRAQRWPIGTLVTLTLDDGSIVETVTRSGPCRVGSSWKILVEDAGWFALARVQERAGAF